MDASDVDIAATSLRAAPGLAASVRDLRKSFGAGSERLTLFDGASFDIAAGERVAVTGESGTGKSTLLHILAGLEPFDAGQVIVSGADLADLDDAARTKLRRSDVAVVFQQFNLIPSLTVRANVSFQARIAGVFDADWTERLLQRLGVGELADRYPERLSGGQQQRAAIARALAVRPKLLLADEPTGNR